MRGTFLVCIAVVGAAFIGCDATPQPPAHTNAWLSYKFSRNCPSPIRRSNCPALFDVSEATNYYNTIGANTLVAPPNGTQFDAWLTANGFNSGALDVRAVYGNRGDLAFGRDMHCLQSGQNIACYVTNFGPPPILGLGTLLNPDWVGINNSGDPTYTFPALENSFSAINDAINGNHPFGTVAMVWTPNSGAANNANNVTFYAFSSRGFLLEIVDLDDETHGQGKVIPRMCMACHGGRYDSPTDSVLGASFLPFDMYSFKFSNDFNFDLYGQQEAFRKLNQLVLATNPPAPAIAEFINGSYPKGVGNTGSIEIDNYVPSGWSPDPDLYNLVVKPYCRTCHLSEGGNADFGSYQKFVTEASTTNDLVCNSHDMPHAEVPYVRFWLKDFPAQQKLRDFLKSQGQTGCP